MYNFFNPQPMYPQFNPMPNYNQPQFKINQVSNIEEARAFIVDPISTYLFVDYNSGKIYMKKMNNNGLADFYTFTVEQNKQETKINPLDEINQRLLNIENKLGGINVQSLSGNAELNEINSKSNDSVNAKSESAIISKSTGNDERKK